MSFNFKRILPAAAGAAKSVGGRSAEKIRKIFIKIKTRSFSKRKLILNYLAPAAAVLTLALTVYCITGSDYGLAVKYGGEDMATVENEAVIAKAYELLNSRLAIPAESAAEPVTYELTSISAEDGDASAFSVYSKIVRMDGSLAGDAVGLYIDGGFVGAASGNFQAISAELDSYIENIKEENKNAVDAEIINDVQYSAGVYPTSALCSVSELAEKAEKLLDVALVEEEEKTEEIPYAVVYNENPEKYEGYSAVTQSGRNGVQTVTVRSRYLNGELLESKVTKTVVTEEPIDEIITVGTKEIPDKGVGSGTFTWPLPYTSTVTSEFGTRWGKLHKGIDISSSGCYGQDIVAADGGVVTWAGYDDSGYGNYIIIDHGNGMQTLYGHCSALYVSAGEEVGKGQTIAAVGASGDVTGTHLHFEIRVNGSYADPRDYL